MKLFVSRLLIFAIPILAYILFLGIYNYLLDPFGVIKGNMAIQKTEPNQRYLKAKHIINNPGKYDSFLFGSSRVGKIDVTRINDLNKWYNYTYSEAVPSEALEDIMLLLENNVQINHVLIGLDEISFLVNPELHKNQSLRKPYMSIANPFLDYLFLEPSISMYKEIKDAGKAKFFTPGMYSTIYDTGSFLENALDKNIEDYKESHINNPKFLMPYWQPYYFENINFALDEISKINDICKNNNINVTYFINPVHITTYLKIDKDQFFYFLKELSKLTDYYDFSGINYVTTSNYYYYETSHYRPLTGNKIIEKIFSKDANLQFGVHVNGANIDSILNLKEKERIDYESLTHLTLATSPDQ